MEGLIFGILRYIVLGHPKLKSVNNRQVASCQLRFLIPKIFVFGLFVSNYLCGVPVNS